jgi:hypothetical protein
MERSAILLSCSLSVLIITGCGGSGSSSGGTDKGGTPKNVPAVNGIAPLSAGAGAPATTITAYGTNFVDGSSIVWNGTALASSCVDKDERAVATCATAGALTATIPVADLAAPGTATVTVSNPGGGTSQSFQFKIAAPPAGSTFVRKVAGISEPRGLVWDAIHGSLYVSVASTDPLTANQIIPIDPVAGTAGVGVLAGNDPHVLSLSSDASYLWAGMDGSGTVQRFKLPGLTKDISFSLPLDSRGDPEQAVALQAAPVNPHTVGVVSGHGGWSPAGDGVYVYDDAVRRPKFVPGLLSSWQDIDEFVWGVDDSRMYGDQYTTIDDGGIAKIDVTSAGATLASYDGRQLNPIITQFDRSNGLLYSFGGAYDPVKLTQVGQFNLPVSGGERCTPDSSLGRYYCVTTYSIGGSDLTAVELWVFDLNTYALLSRSQFGTVSQYMSASSVTGNPLTLVRWGNAGLALRTSTDIGLGAGGIFLIDGAAVNPNAAPDVASGTSPNSIASLSSLSPQSASSASSSVTVTITGTGFSPDSVAVANYNNIQARNLPTTYVSASQLSVAIPLAQITTTRPLEIMVLDQVTGLYSSNELTFTILPSSGNTKITPLNLCGLAMAWDAKSQLLYVGTANYDGAHPNSIVAVNGTNGEIVKTQSVEPDPMFLTVSANGDFLYAAYAGSTDLTQFALPGLNTTASGVLNNPKAGPYFAGDLKAAPTNPHRVAVTLLKLGWHPEALGGVSIFDDGVLQPDFLPGWTGGQAVPALYDTLAWSSSDQLLTSASARWDDGMVGPLYQLQVNPSGVSYLGQGTANFNDGGAGDIHSDFGTGLIYSDDGTVADPGTGAIVGSYKASGLVAPDSSLNRVFILGQTQVQADSGSFTIQSFDEKAFTPLTSITLTNISGSPIQLVRWGSSGLAVLTVGGSAGGLGMLYLIEDASFVSGAPRANFSPANSQENVQQRWKRISKVDVRKMLQKRVVR